LRVQGDWQEYVRKWAASPGDFVLEALFQIPRERWTPWIPGTPKPAISPVGPELWQMKLLDDVADADVNGRRRFAIRSAHGTGKSTTQAWLILWFLLFRRPVKLPCTANSADQLRDVLFAEISLWHRKLPAFLKDMIELNTERAFVKALPEEAFAVARTARPERPEALQGFHSKHLGFFIEEASGIDDVIFETAGGALSSANSWVFMFGNPTRTSGYFFRAFHENRDQWRTYHVKHSDSSRVSPDYAETMAREYGEDSNVFRVRAMGDFPTSEDDAVIPLGLIEAAIGRDVSPAESAVVWGLDVARFGDDSTALAKRRGNVLLEPVREWRKMDLMQTVGAISKEFRETPIEHRPGAINVDVIGMGGGVVDRLRELGLPVRGINVAERPALDRERYMRLRDELWFEGRDWFDSRSVLIPDDPKLVSELVSPKYKLESSGKLKVESKDEMRKRGVKSPNKADAFLLTMAGGDEAVNRRQPVAQHAYDPFSVGTQEYEREIGRQTTAGTDWIPF
jgi:phage terminase large subunit